MGLTKPLAQRHFDQARENYLLYESLRRAGVNLDWALTLLFYTAVQLVQTYAVETAATGFDIPRGHDKRRTFIRTRMLQVWEHYRDLENASQVARYHQDQPDPTDADVQSHVDHNFAVVREFVERHLGINL